MSFGAKNSIETTLVLILKPIKHNTDRMKKAQELGMGGSWTKTTV
jgi:hypothetical protein